MDIRDFDNHGVKEEETSVLHQHENDSKQEKGEYSLVTATLDDDPIKVQAQVEESSLPIWNRTLLPDSALYLCGGSKLLVQQEGVKFFKLLVWTFVGIVFVHFLVKWLHWERDGDYSMSDMILFDANSIALDVMVFYCVGRLFRQRGIDHLAWLGTATVSAVYAAWAKRFSFLQHSLSMWEIHCSWPLELWLFVAALIPLVCAVVLVHVKYAAKKEMLALKAFEFVVSLLIFVVPYASHPNFHLHHWYAFWLFGMHANFNVWWSRATMAWCWGQYINGIAIYGRDPILTCAISFYYSTDQRCPFMECALLEDDDDNLLNHHEYKPMDEPNWRNCTGYIP